ncbi:MAG: hypothetical protein L0206_04480 [Actinobacteria bacterium]|nr:hypothetical protein [Actinomycetota bacterium]
MRTVIRFGALALLVAAALTGVWLTAGVGSAVDVRSNVEVSGTTPEQLVLARWAVRRFEAAGLEPPVVEMSFPSDPSGCDGHLGFAHVDRVSVCTTLVNTMTRRTILHEMSHIWLDQNVDGATIQRFLAVRELSSWNSSDDPWELRGYEQSAEIMAWALGERILTAQIPDNDPAALAPAFELLTGVAVSA